MIDQVSKKLLFNYYLVFVLLIVFAAAGYFINKFVSLDHMSESGIMLETAGILTILVLVPVGLKLHAVKVRSLQLLTDEDEKLTQYLHWSNVRLLLITIPLLLNILLYFLTQHKPMLWGAVIAAIALIFCKPLKGKIERELTPPQEEPTEEEIEEIEEEEAEEAEEADEKAEDTATEEKMKEEEEEQ